MLYIFLVCGIYLLSLPQAYAIPSNQIMRTFGLLPRSIEKSRQKREQNRALDDLIEAQDNQPGATFNKAFHIYMGFECHTRPATNFDVLELSESTRISSDTLTTPLAFSIMIETIKAHLEITQRVYATKGANFDLSKYTLRYHHENEMLAYPENVAIDSGDFNSAHYPDSMRSAAYIYYIIAPVIQDFMSPKEYRLFREILSKISFRDVIELKKPRKTWLYDDYIKNIKLTFRFLDYIEARYLKKFNISRQNPQYQKKLLTALITSNWLAYQSVRSCPMVTLPTDPSYDTRFYYEPPIIRDNYLMGMGFFQRVIKSFNFYKENLTTSQKQKITTYNKYFQTYYKSIEPPRHIKIPFDIVHKDYIQTICGLDPSEQMCQ